MGEDALEVAMRDLREDAGAVAARGIAPRRAAMREPAEDLEAQFDRALPRAVLQIGDEPETTRVVFLRRVIEAERGELRSVAHL